MAHPGGFCSGWGLRRQAHPIVDRFSFVFPPATDNWQLTTDNCFLSSPLDVTIPPNPLIQRRKYFQIPCPVYPLQFAILKVEAQPKARVVMQFEIPRPACCIGCDMKVVSGNPDSKHVSTSFVERQNLTMRMSMRRFTRLTNAFSKKIDNHRHAVALYFVYYNFCRVHQTLRVTPAMEAGVADHVWTVEEMVPLLNPAASTPCA